MSCCYWPAFLLSTFAFSGIEIWWGVTSFFQLNGERTTSLLWIASHASFVELAAVFYRHSPPSSGGFLRLKEKPKMAACLGWELDNFCIPCFHRPHRNIGLLRLKVWDWPARVKVKLHSRGVQFLNCIPLFAWEFCTALGNGVPRFDADKVRLGSIIILLFASFSFLFYLLFSHQGKASFPLFLSRSGQAW